MRNLSINIEEIGADRVGDQLCLFGKMELEKDDYTYMKIAFDGLPCKIVGSTIRFLEMLPYKRNDLIELPGLYIRYEGMEKGELGKILRNIFAIALANMRVDYFFFVKYRFVHITMIRHSQLE